ncbi:MAG: transcription antitermination factor NusB [Spirochaetia bacterium]
MGSRRKARIIAMQALYSWEVSKPDREQLLQFEWVDRREGREETFAFARLITAGVLEELDAVDAAISEHLEHWEISRLSRVDFAILRMAAYSLMFQPDIPASVTINEAVAIAKEFGADDSYKFVNGVVDAIRRDFVK